MANKKNQDKFNFFVPAEISKGKGGDEGKWLIEGICSTTDKDSDGEVLEPAGYDFSPLIAKGYINWNHQAGKSAGAIVGRPTEAAIVNNGQAFHIKGFLYKGLDEAKNVYNLAKTLQEEDPDRCLGWSIEGQALERDPLNPKRITKARITGVALTHASKCPNTFANIVKGEYSEAFVDDDSESIEDKIEKWALEYKDWGSGAGDQYGTEGSVQEFLQNNHEDDAHILKPLCDYISKNLEMEKAMTAEAAQGTTAVESVDGGNEKLKQAFLKKSEVYENILSRIESRDLNLIKSIYSFTAEVGKKIFNMENNITLETIEKAFQILNNPEALVKGEEAKEDKELSEDEQVEKACAMLKENLEKGEAQEAAVSSLKEHFDLTIVDKAIASVIALMEGECANGDKVDGGSLAVANPGEPNQALSVAKGEEEGDVVKAEEVQAIVKSEDAPAAKTEEAIAMVAQPLAGDVLTKADIEGFTSNIVTLINQKFEGTGVILKSLYDKLDIEKAQVEDLLQVNEDLKKSNEDLEKRLTNVENTPVAPRAITSQAQVLERFAKSNVDANEAYSLSNHIQKSQLLDRLMDSVVKGGPEAKAFEKAINQIEAAGGIDDPEALGAIQRAGILVTR